MQHTCVASTRTLLMARMWQKDTVGPGHPEPEGSWKIQMQPFPSTTLHGSGKPQKPATHVTKAPLTPDVTDVQERPFLKARLAYGVHTGPICEKLGVM